MMILIILSLNIFLQAFVASESAQENSALEEKSHAASRNHITHISHITTDNVTYLDKSENLLRIPKKYDDGKRKRKTIKKVPKRTVQKIIKKSKSKFKRNFYQATVLPTQVSNLIQDSLTDKTDGATTEVNQRKKSKKNLKLMRYPMPFQKLPFHNRYRRDNEREVYILKDLDEIQFFSKEDGYDAVKAHVKQYW
ncbi:unnamed protein product, partial [Iphiclides podalirius]